MGDGEERNPSWVTNRLIEANGRESLWSACFRLASRESAALACQAFAEAGALRATAIADGCVLVEFNPALVRHIAAAAVASRAALTGVGDGMPERPRWR
jgi:hypothetical protein